MEDGSPFPEEPTSPYHQQRRQYLRCFRRLDSRFRELEAILSDRPLPEVIDLGDSPPPSVQPAQYDFEPTDVDDLLLTSDEEDSALETGIQRNSSPAAWSEDWLDKLASANTPSNNLEDPEAIQEDATEDVSVEEEESNASQDSSDSSQDSILAEVDVDVSEHVKALEGVSEAAEDLLDSSTSTSNSANASSHQMTPSDSPDFGYEEGTVAVWTATFVPEIPMADRPIWGLRHRTHEAEHLLSVRRADRDLAYETNQWPPFARIPTGKNLTLIFI